MKSRTFYIVALALITLTAAPAPVFAFDFGQEVGNLLATFGAHIFSFIALLFGYAIEFLVFGIGEHMGGQLGFVVNTVWSIMRDLCNLIFIFLFLFIGIRLVLTIENPGSARKALVPLLVAALLVNFSLFFAKAIIDFANVAAVAVYGLFDTGGKIDVASSRAGSLGLQSWYMAGAADLQKMNFSTGIMMMIFFLVAAIAFLTAAIMLVKRYVVLLLGMIVSPLVLIFQLIPNVPFAKGFKDKTQKGVSTFISSAFFPAVFLFLIFIAVQIVGSYTSGAQFSEALLSNNGGSAVGTIIVYCIGIALLFVAMKSASMISESAANMSMSFARKAGGAATLGAAAFAGRQTLGRLGKVVQEGKVGEAIRTSSINRTRLGRLATTSALSGAEKMRTGSYEIRNTKAYTSAAKTAGVPVGGGWGLTTKGFEDVRKEKVKKETDLAEAQAAVLAGVSKAEQEEKEKKAKEDFDKARQELKDTQAYDKALNNRYAQKISAGTLSATEQAELSASNKAVEDAFKKDKETKESLGKAKDEYKEKVATAMHGTKEVRQNIAHAESAAKLPVAEATRATLVSQRSDTVSRMATASPQERAAMQAKLNELDNKISEQEKIIESSQVAAENIVSAERQKVTSDINDKITATQTALAEVVPGSNEHSRLTTQLVDLQNKQMEAQRAADAPGAIQKAASDMIQADQYKAENVAEVTRRGVVTQAEKTRLMQERVARDTTARSPLEAEVAAAAAEVAVKQRVYDTTPPAAHTRNELMAAKARHDKASANLSDLNAQIGEPTQEEKDLRVKREERVALRQQGRQQHEAAVQSYESTVAKYKDANTAHDRDIAQRLRDAAKAARNMKAKQGGISGSLETEGVLGRSLGGKAPFSSTGREAGEKLRAEAPTK